MNALANPRPAPPLWPMTLWHLTPTARLRAIRRDGLQPGKSQSSLQAIFLAADPYTAANYAGMRPHTQHALLRIEATVELARDFGPDNVELQDLLDTMAPSTRRRHGIAPAARWTDCTWQQSMAVCGQLACWAPIAPARITVAEHIVPQLACPTRRADHGSSRPR